MDTAEDVRHQRLLMLLRDECGGSKAQLAKRLDKAYAQVWQWVARNKSADGTYRSISAESARLIEQKFQKEIGWLDKPVTIYEQDVNINQGESIAMPRNDDINSMSINELI